MGQSRPLFHLFLSFQTHIIILQQINVKKCTSSIQCQDSNSQPLEHKSPPITTRPGPRPLTPNLWRVIAYQQSAEAHSQYSI